MESGERTCQSDHAIILDKPPCCIAFCPADPNHFVVGTYHLKKTEDNDSKLAYVDEVAETETLSQSRDGSLLVFKVEGSKM